MDAKYEEIRATGRTTRLVNKYVQQLFQNPNIEIKIRDHHPSTKSNRLLFMRILKRMVNEHPQDHNKLVINESKLTIKYNK